MSPCFCAFNLAASCAWAKDSSLNKEWSYIYLDGCRLSHTSVGVRMSVHMKVLFIGGTGFISTAVSRQLVTAGVDLFLLHRGASHDDLPARDRLHREP